MRHALRQQRTIARTVRIEGFGYWSGEDVTVEFRPAPVHHGVVFVRCDLAPPPRVKAEIGRRIETPRRTTLSDSGASVEMVEHIMAALGGFAVDNCEIRVDRAEMPGCDGSSLPFVEALDAAGIVDQPAAKPKIVVTKTLRVGDDQCWIEAQPNRWPGLSLQFQLEYGSRSPIGCQTIDLNVTPESFRRELAPARTFLLQEEAEWLRKQGLGARVTLSDLLVFDEQGVRENQLRFPDECVRHKALDMVGDIALSGFDIVGRIVAYRSGHRHNADLVRALLKDGEVAIDQRKSA